MAAANASELLGLDAREWLALGQMIVAVAAVVGGLWALHNHRRTKRREAARWLHGVFRDFYLGGKFEVVREQLEYHYAERLGPLLERRIADREAPLESGDTSILRQLDTLLIYIDHVLYLRDKKQIVKKDVRAVFLYWIELMSVDEHAALRCYAAHFKFTRVAKELKANKPYWVAMPEPAAHQLGRSAGACTIRGRLEDRDGRPALVAVKDQGEVQGTLLDLRRGAKPCWLRRLRRGDCESAYDAPAPADPPYARRLVRLIGPPRDAWVYLLAADASEAIAQPPS